MSVCSILFMAQNAHGYLTSGARKWCVASSVVLLTLNLPPIATLWQAHCKCDISTQVA